jgi:predicted ATP-grasp superfamily ATP-dependent carboligase
MRIFVVEYITGGGLAGQRPGSDLCSEAEIMLAALIGDLCELADVRLLVSRDYRLPYTDPRVELVVPRPDEDVWEVWARCIDDCDAVWPIMPESGGALQRISAMTRARGRALLGSDPDAVGLTASKYLTAKTLAEQGINVVPTFRASQAPIPPIPGAWVLKPDDGVACEGLRLFDSRELLCQAVRERGDRSDLVAQPYIRGCAASLSVLCNRGTAALLAVNIQQLAADHDGLHLANLEVNAIRDLQSRYAALARAVAAAIPGLWGYVGIDFVLSASGPVVLEVNPRLTLSYAGLRAALGVNPAALVVRMLGADTVPMLATTSTGATISVSLAQTRVA